MTTDSITKSPVFQQIAGALIIGLVFYAANQVTGSDKNNAVVLVQLGQIQAKQDSMKDDLKALTKASNDRDRRVTKLEANQKNLIRQVEQCRKR